MAATTARRVLPRFVPSSKTTTSKMRLPSPSNSGASAVRPAAPVKQDSDTPTLIEKRDEFHAELPTHNLRALWHNEMRPMTGLPDTQCIPHLWPWHEQRDVVMRSREVTTTAEAERRALLMINPGVGKCPHTTDSLLAAWQLLLPGEKALCHRHTAFAIRFLIEGKGAYTAVGGKKMYMEKGDLILTTQFEWHDHGNDGDEPVIWLDGLDLPMLYGTFPVNFQIRMMQHPDFNGARYHDSVVTTDEPTHFKWAAMRASLEAASKPHARLEYVNKAFPDGHVSRTMACFAEMLQPGATSRARQETANNIFHVVEGSGCTVVSDPDRHPNGHPIAGHEKVLEWKAGDTFCVPSWFRFHHVEKSGGVSCLFNYNDSSALEKLGFYHAAPES